MLFLSMRWVRGNGNVALGKKRPLGPPVICTKKGLAPRAKRWLLFCLSSHMCPFGGHELFRQIGSLV